MKIEAMWPDGFHIQLIQEHGCWRAYARELRRDGTGQFRGATGYSPQVAINKAIAAVQEAMKMPEATPKHPHLNITLNL